MNKFKHTDDYEKMPTAIVDWLEDKLANETGKFDELLGGEVNVVVNNNDLLFLPFKVVKPIDNVEEVGNFTLYFEANNNAGGDAYFVPTRMLPSHQLLMEIKRVTNQRL